MNLLWLALGVVVICIAIGAREFWKVYLPVAVANSCMAKGRKDTARKIYERVLTTPSLFGAFVKWQARFRLSWLFMESGEYARAAELLRVKLRTPPPPAIEAN